MPPKTTATPQSKLAQLKAQITAQLDEDKKQFASIFSNVVDYVQGLDPHEVRAIVSDKVLKPALKKLGLQVVSDEEVAGPVKSKAKVKAKRSGNRKSVTEEDILAYLKTERTVGDVRKELGQLVPKRLDAMEKQKKAVSRKDGLKKYWKAV